MGERQQANTCCLTKFEARTTNAIRAYPRPLGVFLGVFHRHISKIPLYSSRLWIICGSLHRSKISQRIVKPQKSAKDDADSRPCEDCGCVGRSIMSGCVSRLIRGRRWDAATCSVRVKRMVLRLRFASTGRSHSKTPALPARPAYSTSCTA